MEPVVPAVGCCACRAGSQGLLYTRAFHAFPTPPLHICLTCCLVCRTPRLRLRSGRQSGAPRRRQSAKRPRSASSNASSALPLSPARPAAVAARRLGGWVTSARSWTIWRALRRMTGRSLRQSRWAGGLWIGAGIGVMGGSWERAVMQLQLKNAGGGERQAQPLPQPSYAQLATAASPWLFCAARARSRGAEAGGLQSLARGGWAGLR